MSEYKFVTNWKFDSPIENVWDAITKSENWPLWWSCVKKVELIREGDKDGVGSIRRFLWKGKLPYELDFEMKVTRVERPSKMEGIAEGELSGTGIWVLEQSDGYTAVRYDWNVRTTKWWMNLLAPIAKPIFRWNHDYVMNEGGKGLARYLHQTARQTS
jgi:polyketide cyclase/dehydrase/lipid transport protein